VVIDYYGGFLSLVNNSDIVGKSCAVCHRAYDLDSRKVIDRV
jgi:hypothetical protein